MARLHFALGTRYALGGGLYRVREILPDARVLVEDQTSRAQAVVPTQDLVSAWVAGTLRFEGPHPQTGADDTDLHPSTDAAADLQALPPGQRDEAWRRYTLIQPLLALPAADRTRRALDAYAATQRAAGCRVSRASLERWLRAFSASGDDIRALVPARSRSGAPGQGRLAPDLEALIADVLAACAAAPRYRTAMDVYLLVLRRVADANHGRPLAEQLAPPSPRTIYRRIAAAGEPTILRRIGQAERRARRLVSAGPVPARILERVEIDHTALDLILVDPEDRRPIGRPTLTVALDVYSGFPLGCYVGFEPPSYRTVQSCLLHALLPKEDVRARYGTQHPWPAYGLPETLVVDNGPEFVGHDLDDACAQLGIRLERTPVRQPWYKGHIERYFRTHNTGLVHTLPGTTAAVGGDHPEAQACLTLDAFWQLLHLFLLDVYAERVHTGLGGIPARRWAEGLAAGSAPGLPTSAAEARILLGRTATRTVRRTGLALETLRYHSAELATLPLGTTVRVKYDPADLGALHAFDARSPGRWLRVPAVDRAYAEGLSLWAHRVIRQRVRRERGRVDMAALAAAKARIAELAAQEYARTRRQRRRKTAARFLGRERAGTVGTDAASAPADPSPLAPAPSALVEAAAAWDIAADLAAPGWGVAYDDPPHGGGSASRR